MATHSSILARRIPWTEEPGRIQSTGWQRVQHERNDLAHKQHHFGFPGGSAVENLPGNREDPLEKEMTSHSSILAWEIPWAEQPGVAKSWTQLSMHTHTGEL